MYKYLFPFCIALFCVSCAEEKNEFIHYIQDSESINSAEIAYLADDSTVHQYSLVKNEATISRESVSAYDISILEPNQTSTFQNIPAKYVHLNASIEVSRNVFQDYFPQEWAEMKGVNYTSLKITSKADASIFYVAVVHTGSGKEIAKHSEDY